MDNQTRASRRPRPTHQLDITVRIPRRSHPVGSHVADRRRTNPVYRIGFVESYSLNHTHCIVTYFLFYTRTYTHYFVYPVYPTSCGLPLWPFLYVFQSTVRMPTSGSTFVINSNCDVTDGCKARSQVYISYPYNADTPELVCHCQKT